MPLIYLLVDPIQDPTFFNMNGKSFGPITTIEPKNISEKNQESTENNQEFKDKE